MHIIIAIWVLRGLCLAQGDDAGISHDQLSLSADEANNFMTAHTRARRGLHHECYSEGCRFEEVREVLGRTQHAYEYYYTYKCIKFNTNCKVRCHYRKDCTFGDWGSWTGYSRGLGCHKQERYKPYKHPIQTAYRRWNCNGLMTSCPPAPSESRFFCICKKANCEPGTWSAWNGSIPRGGCTTQTRNKPYKVTWSTEAKVGTCQGVAQKCNAPDVDLRKRCSCKKAVCSLRNWSTWSGVAGQQGQCGTQTRTRSYDKSIVYEERSDCGGSVQQNCPESTSETRKHCSCEYVTCKLGEWSGWSPKQLEQGSCGQEQSRRKTYIPTVAYQSYVGSCPSLPQQCPADVAEKRQQCVCAYRDTCELQEWSKWSEDVTEEGCKIQARTRAYRSALKHAQGDDCKGLNTNCLEEPKETRAFCKCKYLECELGAWSEWSSAEISAGSCGDQIRTQSYTGKEVLVDRIGNCNELPTVCPGDKHEKKSMCKCKTVKCEVGDWEDWTGDIPLDTCATESRQKSMTVTNELKNQENTCDGLQTACGNAPIESRNMCNCSYREDCTLQEWGAWNGDVPDVGCAVQIRSRAYNKSITHIKQNSCRALDICPVLRDDSRTKCNCNQIICDWTEWFRGGFDPETKCHHEVRVKNVSSGFSKIERMNNCNEIPSMCTDEHEKRQDCQSGGGSDVIVTSPPPTDAPITVNPTTAFVPATYVYQGCFADIEREDQIRPLPLLYINLRSTLDWNNLQKTIQGCAEEAKRKRFEYFGVQFFGECWGGVNGGRTFARDGPSSKCWGGVGQQRTNAVYRLEHMPACSGEMKFSAHVSSGAVSEGAWCAGNTDKYQWIVVDLKNAKQITGLGTQGGNTDSWVTLYSVEYSEEGESWMPYKEGSVTKIFAGNSDRFTLETHWLKFPINAQLLRFKPLSWTSTHVCMTIRVYGCRV